MEKKWRNLEFVLRLLIPPMTEFTPESAVVESVGRLQVHFVGDVLKDPLLTKGDHV